MTVTQNSAVVTVNNRVDNVGGSGLIDLILRSVMKNLFKVEFPLLSLVVDVAILGVLVLVDADGALGSVNIEVFG